MWAHDSILYYVLEAMECKVVVHFTLASAFYTSHPNRKMHGTAHTVRQVTRSPTRCVPHGTICLSVRFSPIARPFGNFPSVFAPSPPVLSVFRPSYPPPPRACMVGVDVVVDHPWQPVTRRRRYRLRHHLTPLGQPNLGQVGPCKEGSRASRGERLVAR
jgi:hypothetical protein